MNTFAVEKMAPKKWAASEIKKCPKPNERKFSRSGHPDS
jgi:hypothetical protein